MTRTSSTQLPPFRRVELRYAIVFYGGISLAVYSFGQTLEIHSLWVASRLFDKATEQVKYDEDIYKNQQVEKWRPKPGTRRVYYDLLTRIWSDCRIHLTVRIDFLSGTSAGGINGIVLSRALVTGCEVRPLISIWLETADIKHLVYQPQPWNPCWVFPHAIICLLSFFGWIFGWVLQITRLLFGALVPIFDLITGCCPCSRMECFGNCLVDLFLREHHVKRLPPFKFLLEGVVAFFQSRSLFRGDWTVQQFTEAISKLKPSSTKKKSKHKHDDADDDMVEIKTLQTPLTLFTTTTDIQSFPNVLTKEEQNTILLRWSYDKTYEINDFTNDRELGFACRATSSVPFAFPSTNFKHGATLRMRDCFGKELYPVVSTEDFLRNQLRRWKVDYKDNQYPEGFFTNELADGGLVMNKPFKPVIDELNERHLSSGENIQRRLLYLDPNPPGTLEGKNNDKIPELFTEEEYKQFGDSKFLKMFQNRFEELTRDRKTRFKWGLRFYDWIWHLWYSFWAVFSQPIANDFEEVALFNQDLKRMQGFMLNGIGTSIRMLEEKLESNETVRNHRFVKMFWMCEDTPGDLDAQELREMLGYFALNLTSTETQAVYLQARFDDFKIAASKVLAGRTYLDFPEGTQKRIKLENKMSQYFPQGSDFIRPDGFAELLVNNLFFLRDLLFMMVRFLENPTWLTSGTDNSSSKRQSQQLQLDDQDQQVILKLSHCLRKQIKELDERIANPPSDWDPSDNAHFEYWCAGHFDSFRLQWTLDFSEMLVSTVKELELILHREIPKSDSERCKRIRQAVYRPMILQSYYEIFTFPFLCGAAFGDNSLNKIIRLCPDSIDPPPNEDGHDKRPYAAIPRTALFRNAREKIRLNGHASFAEVFLRSSDIVYFAGFLDKSLREFDIVWGRLDGSEQMCRTVLDAVDDEIKREKEEMKLIHQGEQLPYERKTCPNVLSKSCFEAALQVLEQDVPIGHKLTKKVKPEGPYVNCAHNRKFFLAMKQQIKNELKCFENRKPHSTDMV